MLHPECLSRANNASRVDVLGVPTHHPNGVAGDGWVGVAGPWVGVLSLGEQGLIPSNLLRTGVVLHHSAQVGYLCQQGTAIGQQGVHVLP